MSENIRPMIEDFADIFYRQRKPRLAFEMHVAADYIQHSPMLLDGTDNALAMLEPLFRREGARFDVKRILIDGDMAAIHLHGRPDPDTQGKAVVDIYRIEGGKIVEHWDVVQPLPDQPINPREMV